MWGRQNAGPTSESDLQTELQIPRRVGYRGHLAEALRRHRPIRSSELGMIEQIVELGAELGRDLMILDADVEALRHYRVHIAQPARAHIRQKRSGIAKSKGRGVGKNAGVEPAIDVRIVEFRALAIVDDAANAHREPTLRADDSAQLPAAQNGVRRLAPGGAHRAAAAERQ